MKRRGVALGSLTMLLVIVVFGVFLGTRPVAPEATSAHSPLLGQLAPNFRATTLEGRPFSLAAERGKIVVLSFWASWCGPCQQDAPEISTFAWREKSHGVAVIGVVWQDDVNAARSFQRSYGSLYSSVIDPGGAIANQYGVTAPPTIFIVNAHGRVAATLLGATTASQLTAAVARVAA